MSLASYVPSLQTFVSLLVMGSGAGGVILGGRAAIRSTAQSSWESLANARAGTIDDLTRKVAALEHQVDQVKAERRDFEQRTQGRYDALMQRNDKLEALNITLQQENSQLRQDNAALRAEIAALRSRLETRPSA